MTPSQQSAVQAVYTAHGGGTLTAQQITDIGPMVDARNDAGVAIYLSNGLTVAGSVSPANFLAWAVGQKLRGVIEDVSKDATSPLRDSALAMLDIIANKTDLDLSASQIGQGNVAALNGWVTVGKITSAQESQLLAMAQQAVTIPFAAISAALNAPGI